MCECVYVCARAKHQTACVCALWHNGQLFCGSARNVHVERPHAMQRRLVVVGAWLAIYNELRCADWDVCLFATLCALR